MLNNYNVGLAEVDYKIRLPNTNPIKSYIPCHLQGLRGNFEKIWINEGG